MPFYIIKLGKFLFIIKLLLEAVREGVDLSKKEVLDIGVFDD